MTAKNNFPNILPTLNLNFAKTKKYVLLPCTPNQQPTPSTKNLTEKEFINVN